MRENIIKLAAKSGVGAMIVVEILGRSQQALLLSAMWTHWMRKGVSAVGVIEDHSLPPQPSNSPTPQSAAVGRSHHTRK
jgi:hypothetical protein